MSRMAQSVIEYVLIMVVIIMALLFATREGGPLRNGLSSYFGAMGASIANVAGLFEPPPVTQPPPEP